MHWLTVNNIYEKKKKERKKKMDQLSNSLIVNIKIFMNIKLKFKYKIFKIKTSTTFRYILLFICHTVICPAFVFFFFVSLSL